MCVCVCELCTYDLRSSVFRPNYFVCVTRWFTGESGSSIFCDSARSTGDSGVLSSEGEWGEINGSPEAEADHLWIEEMETGYEDPKVLSPLRRPEGQLEMIDERGLLGEVGVFRLPTPMILFCRQFDEILRPPGVRPFFRFVFVWCCEDYFDFFYSGIENFWIAVFRTPARIWNLNLLWPIELYLLRLPELHCKGKT